MPDVAGDFTLVCSAAGARTQLVAATGAVGLAEARQMEADGARGGDELRPRAGGAADQREIACDVRHVWRP